jgi:hypothetical protein
LATAYSDEALEFHPPMLQSPAVMHRSKALASLPTARIAPTVKAGYEQNSVGFNLVKQAVRKSPHQGASAPFMNSRKPPGGFCDELDCLFDRLNESL